MMSNFSGGVIAIAVIVTVIGDGTASAQFPNWEAKPVRPRIDVIPPLGNNLPLSYRARMNRPSYVAGRIAYTIAPSSQEAMAWQRARERGYYANHAPRMETHYMFPKPWEVLGVGSKPKLTEDPKAGFMPPERMPLGPIHDGEPGEDGVKLPPELVPLVRPDSRPPVDGPPALELAPPIELPVE